MANLPRLLRLARADASAESSDFYLLRVSSAGKHPLDLKLIGTEGQFVYKLKFKHPKLSSFQHSNYKGTEDEFEHLLSVILLGAEGDKTTHDIEAVAKTRKGAATIYIQRSIQGITQRYGEINLAQEPHEDDGGEGIDFPDWCELAIRSRKQLEAEMDATKQSLREREEERVRLCNALAELTQLKIDSENALLEKFSLLLNEKKSKIRDQQRLLASAVVDPAKVAALEAQRSEARSRSPGPSRHGKRKAAKVEEESDDDAFEKMDVDGPKDGGKSDSEEEREQQQTPDQSTEDEDSEEEQPTRSQRSTRAVSPASKQKTAVKAATQTQPPVLETLPPKRELPFAKKKAVTPEPEPAPEPAAESETEDEDEL